MVLGSFLLYCGALIILRLRITQMAYEFEDLKAYERTLKEEQLKLRASVSERLSPAKLRARVKTLNLDEPQPDQVVAIP